MYEPRPKSEHSVVCDEVIGRVGSGNSRVFFLGFPGGTGKTFFINLPLIRIRRDRKIGIAVASSRIAATLMEGGKMAHPSFKLPLKLNSPETTVYNIPKQSHFA